MGNYSLTGSKVPIQNPNHQSVNSLARPSLKKKHTPPQIKTAEAPLPPEKLNKTQTFERHKSQPLEVSFEAHQNDITIMAATRRGENAVTWLSPEIIKNWKPDESIDQVLDKVSGLDNERLSHHPTVFRSNQKHQPVGDQQSLIFANSDYNEDGDAWDRGDLIDVKTEGVDLKKAYSKHGYQTQLHENSDASKMFNTIQDKLGKLKPGDELVVHYSGHGSKNGAAVGTRSKWDQLNPLNILDNTLDLNGLYASRVQNLVDDAQDRGIKLVMVFDSCESGQATDYVRHREMEGLGNQLKTLGERQLSSKENARLSSAKVAFNKAQNNLKQIDHLTSDKPLVFENNGKIQKFKMDKSQYHLKLQKDKINASLVSGKITPKEAEKKLQKLIDVISQRDAQIQALEEETDQLMSASYEHLNSIDGFDFNDSQFNPNQLKFSSGTSVGLQSGAMVDLRLDYNLMDYSRDRSIGLAFSAGIGTGNTFFDSKSPPQIKLTEAITFDQSAQATLELGMAQTLDTEGKLTPWLHAGASYDITPNFSLFGGLDFAIADRGGDSHQFNPYLGARKQF